MTTTAAATSNPPDTSETDDVFPFLAPTSFMDDYQTPLNACSVEATPHPIHLAARAPVEHDNHTTDSSSSLLVWPTITSCYQLMEDGKTRRGCMDLFLISTPHVVAAPLEGGDAELSSLSFGTPYPIHPATIATHHNSNNRSSSSNSGILDGKWYPYHYFRDDDAASQNSNNHDDGDNRSRTTTYFYATARSSGEVSMDRFEFFGATQATDDDDGAPLHSKQQQAQPPFSVQTNVGTSEDSSDHVDARALCLSLNWDDRGHRNHSSTSTSTSDEYSQVSDTPTTKNDKARIVSTYSNGEIKIHDVLFQANSVVLLERDGWTAHTSFVGDAPAEVWSACFVGDGTSDTNLVLSGGDDCKMKLWDLRSTTRPSQVLQPFDAGVTVVASDPRREYICACGSYDETVALYDVRYASKTPLARSPHMGGGIWRIQWHPKDDQRLLLACMHGGCRVVNVDLVEEECFRVTRQFTQHESMAYGAAWLVCRHPHPKREEYYEAAVSCSFYDKAAFLWRAVRSSPAEI